MIKNINLLNLLFSISLFLFFHINSNAHDMASSNSQFYGKINAFIKLSIFEFETHSCTEILGSSCEFNDLYGENEVEDEAEEDGDHQETDGEGGDYEGSIDDWNFEEENVEDDENDGEEGVM